MLAGRATTPRRATAPPAGVEQNAVVQAVVDAAANDERSRPVADDDARLGVCLQVAVFQRARRAGAEHHAGRVVAADHLARAQRRLAAPLDKHRGRAVARLHRPADGSRAP